VRPEAGEGRFNFPQGQWTLGWRFAPDERLARWFLAGDADAATGKLLDNNKSPSPKTGQLDNRGSQFYLTMYRAQELARQTEDAELAKRFAPLAKTLSENEQKIVEELNAVQGKAVDIGGYYFPDRKKVSEIMRPSATFNRALETAKG
jgi:isocitrate dehydrogenase